MRFLARSKHRSLSNEICKVSSFLVLALSSSIELTSFRELEQDLVPEWRAKYFDYKVDAGFPQWSKGGLADSLC